MDIALAVTKVNAIKHQIAVYRNDVEKYHALWYKSAIEICQQLDVPPSTPRITSRQTSRANTESSDPEEYYRRVLTIPLLGNTVLPGIQNVS
jgi:hypothetical protein